MLTLEQVIDTYPLPAPMGGVMTLEPMQKEDIVRAVMWRRALLDLPVGYGKTVIATCIGLVLQPDITVVLVPPILIAQWVAWLNSIPGAGRVVDYTGSPAARRQINLNGAQWLVTSYQLFNNDIERLSKEMARADVLTVVDECQNLKGRGVLFKNVRSFSTARDLILMSGTIASKVGDHYAYIKLNSPEVYATYTQFENIHVKERDIFKQPIEWHNLDLLQANLNLRRIHRTKEEVHSALPKGRIIPVYYDLSKEHMALYKRLMEEQLLLLDDGGKIDATTATRLYHAAQQIVIDFGYFAGDETKRSVVFDLIDEICDEIGLGGDMLIDGKLQPASKLILWTQHRSVSRLVGAHMDARLAKIGKRAVMAFSEVDSKKSVKQFMEDPDTVQLTAQPGSAGAGLNPQYMCWEAAFIQMPTTTIPFIQSTGRIDRKGQRYPPNNRLLIARGTIQERLLKSLQNNDELVNKASGSKQGIKDMLCL
jgi:SNF2 family DNA or RNA helicase